MTRVRVPGTMKRLGRPSSWPSGPGAAPGARGGRMRVAVVVGRPVPGT